MYVFQSQAPELQEVLVHVRLNRFSYNYSLLDRHQELDVDIPINRQTYHIEGYDPCSRKQAFSPIEEQYFVFGLEIPYHMIDKAAIADGL